MAEISDNDPRVVVVSASDPEGECPECGLAVTDEWPVALDTERYGADVTHECPDDACEGAASFKY